MYDLRNLPGSKHLRAACLVLLGALCAFQVAAAPFSSSQSGNSVTYASNSYASDAAIAGAALTVSAGVVYASQPSTVRTLAGAVAPLVVRAAPIAGAIGSTVAACFANPLCVVATAAAAAYVGNELYYNYSVDPVTGAPVVTKKDPTVCTVAPCNEFGTRTRESTAITIWRSSKNAACDAAAKQMLDSLNASIYDPARTITVTDYNTCTLRSNSGTYYNNWGYGTRTVSPSAPVYAPSSASEMATAIGAKTDWANDSKITELLEKIVKNTSQSIPLQVPTVTGPTSIPSTPTVTTKADGSKTTTTRTSSLGYYGPRVDVTETTVVQDTTPAGVTTTTTTTESPAYVEDKAPATDYDTPQVDIPKATKTITFAAENLGFGGGTCPADVMSQPHGMAASIKLVDWTSNCNYVTTYAKPMILAMALFSALMIIFVGGKPE